MDQNASPTPDHDAKINAEPIQTGLTHLDQYKMLREEIMQNMRALDTVQYAGAVGAAGIYTWLILNAPHVSSKFIWFVPTAALVFCSVKSWDLTNRIWQIATYLVQIREGSISS